MSQAEAAEVMAEMEAAEEQEDFVQLLMQQEEADLLKHHYLYQAELITQ